MIKIPAPTRRRALPLCLGLLASAALAACDRRPSTPPAGPAGTAAPTTPPELPSSGPARPPASGASP